ncbi:probable phospholipid-transporting ATPase IF isoform X2 [Dendronephthya gigantea]|uniref:probable phospholipid-transporting ATPase IF isoform X2 n=1 Tax=Dendronephthya gigantea TaxID=151771 RepID=UPI00106B269C|nr:probable phospholipid-transporting ATPase IF isoform X2 [Dendronephthya gigantea]
MAFDSIKDWLGCWSGNYEGEFRTVYFLGRLPENDVDLARQYHRFPDNAVVSSKYTVWNFLPKNLFEQFRRIANFYFLCISVVQLFIDSPVSPLTSIFPLCFVVAVTALKQGYEDWKRHQADKEVNNRKYELVSPVNGALISVISKDIKVGDIVMVKAEEEFPCDLILLSSEDSEGKCHVTTANLDGETNLKLHSSLPDTTDYQTSEKLYQLPARIECEHPMPDLYKFQGRMIFDDGETKSLGPTQVLLRGARLKNTSHVFGVAVYTGMDTKMALNQRQNPHKYSSVERKMNTFLILFLVVLLVLCIIHTVLKSWYQGTDRGGPPYVEKADTGTVQSFEDFLSFLILYNYVIPISLYVTIELQKFTGALFFNWDVEMYNEETDEPAKANTSDLNEELGQIQYVFTDKTGTLTENDMQFRTCSINGRKYEELDGLLCADGLRSRNFESSNFTPEMREFFLTLSLCHTVHATEEEDKDAPYPYFYQASSPDEKAFVEASHRYGLTFQGTSGEHMQVKIGNEVQSYKLLHVLEFDSTRKRMSVIISEMDGTIVMYCKGAETAILEKTIDGPTDVTLAHINSYAEKGLRTLAIAKKVIPKEKYEEMNAKLKEASEAINERDEQLAKVYEDVESGLTLLGATGIEDRLQDKVKETIVALREAGMKVWVLTGDKHETAVNISHSCGHVQANMDVLEIVRKDNVYDVEQSLYSFREKLLQATSSPDKKFALVIDGSSLRHAFDGNKELFISVCQYCVAVLCCRMSPLQKAQVVHLMKHSSEKPITLAIGDGANDCSMIQEAHVGIGVMGKEGRQAVRTSDYAISRFKFLRRVLLVHGHLYYIRLATVVQYFFYKNVVFTIPQYLYAFYNAYSQQTLYQSVFLTTFNICWTSLPILLYGIFEQHLRADTLTFQPVLYRDISGNKRLSWHDFSFWMLSALWHGLIIYFGSFLFFDEGILSDKAFGNWSFGQFVYTIVVIVCNLKLGLFSFYWTILTHIVIWGSIISYILFAVIASCSLWEPFQFGQASYDLYWTFEQLLEEPSVWFGFILLSIVAVTPDMAIMTIARYFYRTKTQLAQLLERNPKSMGVLRKRPLSQIVSSVKNQTHGYGTIAPSPSSVILVDLSDDAVDNSQDRV